MSKASRAAEQKLRDSQSLQYGDYNVTKDWLYAGNPLAGIAGQSKIIAFNPNDTTQRFGLNDSNGAEAQQLMEYLSLDGRNPNVAYDKLNQYFSDFDATGNSATGGLRGSVDKYFGQSLEQIAEEKRLQDLTTQIQSGQITAEQGTQMANTPQTTPKTLYQQTYDETKANQTTPGSGMTYLDRLKNPTAKNPSTKTFSDITPISTPNFSLSGTNLNVGSTGSDVSQLQEFINFATGSNLKVDGQYGSQTQNAVKQLQSRLGITADGIVGPQTTKALNEYMAKILKANPSIKAPTSINSGNLQPGSTTNLPSRNSTTSSGADSLIGGITANMSAEEAKVAKQYNELEGEVSKLLGNSVGQGQAQLDAEKVAGVPQLEQELSNLNAQIKVGLAEYQIEKDKYDALSLENRNKPVTMNSIIGSEAAIDFARQQALNRKASDIGLLQAQASGVAGNLELAQNTANKAVELKYADIKTMLDVKMQQLSILGDKLSREEKKTADFLNRQYEMQKAEIDAQEADEKALNNFTLDAMQNYRSAGIRLGDSYETIQSKILGSSEYRAETTKSSGGGTGNSNQMTDNERALMGQFRAEPIVKDYNEILGQKGTIDAYIQNGVGGPADLALVFSFMKGLDPTSVVRETEYANAAKSGNIFSGAWTKFNGYFKEKGGILPANVKQEFQNLVNQRLAVKQKQYENVKSQYEGIAQRQGLNTQNVVIDYAAGGMGDTNSGSNSGDWATSYNYEQDIQAAQEAIAGGADPDAVKKRLLTKYAEIDL